MAVWSDPSEVAQTYDKMKNGIMKKVFLASSALVLTAGFAYADVTITGDGRMGILDGYDAKDFCATCTGETEIGFNSRVRITFTASGETDTGLSFGGSIRADNAAAGASGTAGNVSISGSFGKLSMGDVDGGAKASVGHAAGVGYTGLGDNNEIFYMANAGTDPSLLYSHSMAGFSVNVSADNPSTKSDSYSVGVSYKFNDMLTAAVGGERTKKMTIEDFAGIETLDLWTDWDGEQFVAGAWGQFGPVMAKGVVSDGEVEDMDANKVDLKQMAGSIGFDATEQFSLTGFFRNSEAEGATFNDTKVRAFGVGASYDLGGGASIVAGVTNLELETDDKVFDGDSNNFDLGLSFSF